MANKIKISEVSPLKSHLGYHLRAVSNAVSHSFAIKLAKSGVTVAEWVILREMYSQKENISPSLISELIGLTRGAVSKLIDRLLQKQLVIRLESVSDRRFQEIGLTAKARRLIPRLSLIADENDKTYFSVLTDGERKTLRKTLLKLIETHRLYGHPLT